MKQKIRVIAHTASQAIISTVTGLLRSTPLLLLLLAPLTLNSSADEQVEQKVREGMAQFREQQAHQSKKLSPGQVQDLANTALDLLNLLPSKTPPQEQEEQALQQGQSDSLFDSLSDLLWGH